MRASPLSLYIHLPWCVQKCPYCDFNSHADPQPPESTYIDALIADLDASLPSVWGRSVQTIFFGGGTPSLFSPKGIERILSAVRARLRLAPTAEITLEANPGTVEREKFQDFRHAGVTRLSIGIQSFDDVMLRRLERIHDGSEARLAVEAAKLAGFDNFNLDLMFGLPGQTVEQAISDLRQAIDHAPSHISRYQLTIEPNTLFHHQPPRLPDEALLWEMQSLGGKMLASSGFQSYEVSAWSQPGMQCRHNRNYWEFGDYLGIGAGAHGKITDQGTGEIQRLSKHRRPEDYMARRGGSFVNDLTLLPPRDLPFEFMLNALRLTQGVDTELFTRRTGLNWDTISETVNQLRKDGLLVASERRLAATSRGLQFLNDVVARFLP
ncbi:MAG TPA: oxygen-independent coproporphyrinogen III oxidase-like protein [Rhodobacteraceae bacterium]|nr:oxygen-independent coproporphyrinogen III oxidase-like protein [Paracoccaceae bacterium]